MIQNEGSCRCRGFSLGLHHSRLPGTRGQVSETRFSQSQPSSSWLGGSQHSRFGDGACFQHGTASDASAAPDRPRAKCEESSRTAADPMRPQGRDPHASLRSQPEDARDCCSYSYLLFIPEKAQLGLVFKSQQFLILFPTPVPRECSVDQPDFPVLLPCCGVTEGPSAPRTLFQRITQVI